MLFTYRCLCHLADVSLGVLRELTEDGEARLIPEGLQEAEHPGLEAGEEVRRARANVLRASVAAAAASLAFVAVTI